MLPLWFRSRVCSNVRQLVTHICLPEAERVLRSVTSSSHWPVYTTFRVGLPTSSHASLDAVSQHSSLEPVKLTMLSHHTGDCSLKEAFKSHVCWKRKGKVRQRLLLADLSVLGVAGLCRLPDPCLLCLHVIV